MLTEKKQDAKPWCVRAHMPVCVHVHVCVCTRACVCTRTCRILGCVHLYGGKPPESVNSGRNMAF